MRQCLQQLDFLRTDHDASPSSNFRRSDRSVLSESCSLFPGEKTRGEMGGADRLVEMMRETSGLRGDFAGCCFASVYQAIGHVAQCIYNIDFFGLCGWTRNNPGIEKVSVLLFSFPHRVVLCPYLTCE